MAQKAMADPGFMQSVLAANPAMSALIEGNPRLKAMITSPDALQGMISGAAPGHAEHMGVFYNWLRFWGNLKDHIPL